MKANSSPNKNSKDSAHTSDISEDDFFDELADVLFDVWLADVAISDDKIKQ